LDALGLNARPVSRIYRASGGEPSLTPAARSNTWQSERSRPCPTHNLKAIIYLIARKLELALPTRFSEEPENAGRSCVGHRAGSAFWTDLGFGSDDPFAMSARMIGFERPEASNYIFEFEMTNLPGSVSQIDWYVYAA